MKFSIEYEIQFRLRNLVKDTETSKACNTELKRQYQSNGTNPKRGSDL
jgi:hypothetical protein